MSTIEFEDSPAYRSIRDHSLAKPGAVEEYPWGHPVWKVDGKMFATYGDDGGPHISVKCTLDKQAILIQHPAIEKAPYVGRYGWLSIAITDDETTALTMDLIDDSYDSVAPKSKRNSTKPDSR